MQRIYLNERPDWQQTAKEFGFYFHSPNNDIYWDETAAYCFSLYEVEHFIEDATTEIHNMTMDLVEKIISSEELLETLAIPPRYWDFIYRSWNRGDQHLYGRMDFSYHSNQPAKLLELNYDTPTTLYEAAIFQWVWLEQQIERNVLPKNVDQFNSLQEKLVLAFAIIAKNLKKPLHLSCCKGSQEDYGTVEYLRDCAMQAGLSTDFIYVEDIIWEPSQQRFLDQKNIPIELLFKLYPWEDLFLDEFAEYISDAPTLWLEPVWKSILSNKAILPLLWKYYPNHPNLLECYFETKANINHPPPKGWVRKPFFSREGENISISLNNGEHIYTDGDYESEQCIIQACAPLPEFNHYGKNVYPLIGSWVIGDQPAGMGIREDYGLITRDTARFIPHYILD